MADEVAPLDVLRAVLDPVRLAVLGAAAEGEVSIEDLAGRLKLRRRDVAKAIGDLRAIGVLDDDCRLDTEVLASVGRSLPREHPELGEPVQGPWTAEEAIILGRFFAGDRLVEVPKSASKRRLVLEKIVQEFEPGQRYPERELNFRIQLIHADYAAMRRYMVDEGLMDRADGVYWRTGGRHEVSDVVEPSTGERAHALTTENGDVVLRPYGWEMIDELIEAADDERISVYMGDEFPSPYTRDAAEEWLEIATSSDPPLQYGIYVDGAFEGGIGALLLKAENTGVAEIGWWLNPEHWGKGIVTAAVTALIDEMFEHRGLIRLWAPVMHPNRGSARVAEKAGMTLEGIAPSHYVKQGVRYDQLNYGITREQWENGR